MNKCLLDLGQSIWLDNIARDLLDSGMLKRYIDELCVTGLTSNPTVFDRAIRSAAYDRAIQTRIRSWGSAEALFFELALEDIGRSADLLRSIHDCTDGVDGWVSLDVSPLLADDTEGTLVAVKALFARVKRRSVMIKIPGTKHGLPAIEAAIFAGVPVNVTLLFSRGQYLAAAAAFVRGIERRIAVGLNPNVGSVASMFVNGWDAAVMDKVPNALRDPLRIAIAKQTYASYRALLDSARWQHLEKAGARPQRLLWARMGTEVTKASDIVDVNAFAAPFTVNAMPESALKALIGHGDVGERLPADGGDAEERLARVAKAGIDVDNLAARLQDEGMKSFMRSWNDLMTVIARKRAALTKAS
jgi:transaldolase